MKLFYYSGLDGVRNFGDELNHDIWSRYLPGAFDDSADGTQFVGIGTLLNDRLPMAPRTIVFGAGVGYYGPPHPDATWSIYCVRGPLSAHALSLPRAKAITDPGVLVARVAPAPSQAGARSARSFMPHWQSEPDVWKEVCEAAGMTFVDPRWPPSRVLDMLRRTDLLLTEAMHGAIVADALRVPWIAIRTREEIKAFKWEDWCQSMGIDYRPHTVPAVWPSAPGLSLIRRARRRTRLLLIAQQLRRLAHREHPTLSQASVLDARLRELEDRLEELKIDIGLSAPLGAVARL